jgi:hypothetical protein
MNTKPVFNIYNEFNGLIRQSGYGIAKNGAVLMGSKAGREVAVYIPSVHVRYTNSAIWHVFEYLFGVVTRIDTVSVKTKEGVSERFKSVFVYFATDRDIDFSKQIRINPNVGTPYMNRYFGQPNAKVRKSEYWMVLPNTSAVSYTTLTLAEIESKMNTLEGKIANYQVEEERDEEKASLDANRYFLVELRAKQNQEVPAYVDTSINVHQLARNIELMELRFSASATQSATAAM